MRISAKERYKAFVQEMIRESDVIEDDEITAKSFSEAFFELENRGFKSQELVALVNDDFPVHSFGYGEMFVHSKIYGCDVYQYDMVPENHVIILHPKSISDTPPQIPTPGVVVYPKGIVTLKEK